MRKIGILWVSAVSLVVVSVVGALVTLAMLSGNPQQDTTPPIISDVVLSNVTYGPVKTVEFAWITNEAATTEAEYSAGSRTHLGQRVGPSGPPSTDPSVALIWVQP